MQAVAESFVVSSVLAQSFLCLCDVLIIQFLRRSVFSTCIYKRLEMRRNPISYRNGQRWFQTPGHDLLLARGYESPLGHAIHVIVMRVQRSPLTQKCVTQLGRNKVD